MVLAIMMVVLLLTGCDLVGGQRGSTTSNPCGSSGLNVPRGAYCYTAFDESGEAVVQGRLVLVIAESDDANTAFRVTGSWMFRQLAEGREVGPQVGQGAVRGSIGPDGQVFLDLNPMYADNNVFLTGTFGPDGFEALTGDWFHSTLLGQVAEGSFEAKQP
jgi:hypothetical protein